MQRKVLQEKPDSVYHLESIGVGRQEGVSAEACSPGKAAPEPSAWRLPGWPRWEPGPHHPTLLLRPVVTEEEVKPC